jgi:hypothetical protein
MLVVCHERIHDFEVEDKILSILGVPEDTTVELGMDDPNYFCRDYYSETFYALRDGNCDKEKIIEEIWENTKSFRS